MKDQQAYPNRSSRDDQDIVDQINKSLENFDEAFSIEIPQPSYFEQKIKMQRAETKKKWLKELLIFTVTAAIILGFLFLALFHQPEVFLALQVLTVVFICFYTMLVKRKVKMGHE
ncbi:MULTISPECIES: YxlC family protein [unclassified Peribacillus]|uniref:YxlC family protein n=1 Tax=unclassified Peribacillus TaxID=2675266 RepID=UPI001E50994A|nr:YxlC family protein [Peribacillus sp. Bi96]